MGSRFEKFSERARRALALAQEEAQRFNHNYIGTEHILLGLIRETEGAAARVLSSLSIDLSKVRWDVESIIERGEKPTQGAGEIGLTADAKKVVELAVDETRRMNNVQIGTEHLLIGILREGEGVAAGVLKSLGVTLDGARAATHQVLGIDKPTLTQAEVDASFGIERALRKLAERLVQMGNISSVPEQALQRLAEVEKRRKSLAERLAALQHESSEAWDELRAAVNEVVGLLDLESTSALDE